MENVKCIGKKVCVICNKELNTSEYSGKDNIKVWGGVQFLDMFMHPDCAELAKERLLKVMKGESI